MVQPHNRHISFSLYISVLAVSDTIALITGKYTLCNENTVCQGITLDTTLMNMHEDSKVLRNQDSGCSLHCNQLTTVNNHWEQCDLCCNIHE